MIRLIDEASGSVTFDGNHSRVSQTRSLRVSQIHTLKHRYNSSAGPMYHPSTPWGDHESRALGFS